MAGQNVILLNAPSFAETAMSVGDETFTIRTEGFVEPTHGGPVQYVQSMQFNGEPLHRSWMTATEFYRGGELLVTLGPAPGDWATAADTLPPSRARAVPVAAPTNPTTIDRK